MIVAHLTTPANYFHIIRRQMFLRKPLVIFTPKSMLRHPLAVSPISDFTTGRFVHIYDDNHPSPEKVEKIVLLTGKVYWDLLSYMNQKHINNDNFAIIRVEQLYPLHVDFLLSLINKYSKANKIVWFQEEPQNMGAWNYILESLADYLPRGLKLNYIGRAKSASPATGSFTKHNWEQEEIIENLLRF